MKIIERTDAEALSWPVGSQHEIDGEMFIVAAVHHGSGARVILAERDEWILRSSMSPFVSCQLRTSVVKGEVAMSCAEFLWQIRHAMLRELGVK